MNKKKIRTQVQSLRKGKVLLILPCNAGACIGNYFKADSICDQEWHGVWREADLALHDLRKKGRVVFAAVDSCTLETEPEGSKGAIVFETEMGRVKNPGGKDWGAPSWRWFRPAADGSCEYLETLTESLTKGIHRVEKMGFSQVFALVNPRGYYLSLVAAVERCGLLNKWVLFRVPAHPRHLLPAVQQILPIVRAATEGKKKIGGIYSIPAMFPFLLKENKLYKDSLPRAWQRRSSLRSTSEVKTQWLHLTDALRRK